MAQVAVCSQINTKHANTVWAERTVVVFKLLVWCVAEGYVSGLQDDAPYRQQTAVTLSRFVSDNDSKCTVNEQHPANRAHNPQLHTRPAT